VWRSTRDDGAFEGRAHTQVIVKLNLQNALRNVCTSIRNVEGTYVRPSGMLALRLELSKKCLMVERLCVALE
jgi:hypothetical protein